MEPILTVVCLLIVAVISLLGVFHPAFDDSLVQRICLGGFCLGTLALAKHVIHSNTVSDPVMWGSILAAVWGLESLRRCRSCK